MDFQLSRWRFVLPALVLALFVTALPMPAGADDGSQPSARPGLRASIASSATLAVSKAPAPATSRAQTTGDAKAPLESKSFFKTPAGAAVLAIFAAGTGYAIYSANHDRIRTVGR